MEAIALIKKDVADLKKRHKKAIENNHPREAVERIARLIRDTQMLLDNG